MAVLSEHSVGAHPLPLARLGSLLIFLLAAAAASQLLCGLLVLAVGSLAGWVWCAVTLSQLLPAIFLAAAMIVSGEPE
jgi:hypothetical protein